MIKETYFLGRSESGIFAQALFGSAGAFEKTAGAPPFSDWETGEDIRKYLRTITSEDRKKYAYVLVNALGAGEFYGPNINADYFPWDALAHEGDDYGYKTFLRAHAFQHHANKDPERAFGTPVLSLLNPSMKRVELVIRIDKDRARQFGADGIITRIENGEFPDVSMGCKVPFDVCSKCGHRSKTRDDYCIHMRPPEELRGIYGPNKILPDGTKIYVLNLTPRFFDISFVFIGADKTAKVMAKLASKGDQLCIGPVCAVPPPGQRSEAAQQVPLLYDVRGEPLVVEKRASACDGMRGPCGRLCSECAERTSCHIEKLASGFGVKKVAQKKLAEIVKDVPAGVFAVKKLPVLEGNEPDIKGKDLDELAKSPVPSVLSAVTRLGMLLKPHEFQRIVLRRMGEDDLVEKLDREHKVFRSVPEFDFGGLGSKDPLDSVFELLKKYVKERTALGPSFQIRVIISGGSPKNVLPTRRTVEHPLLDKVSAAYNGYRRSVLKKLSQVVSEVRSDPRLREEVLGEGLGNMFSKTASTEILSLDSMKYFLGAHLQDRSLLCSDAVAGAAVLESKDLFAEILA